MKPARISQFYAALANAGIERPLAHEGILTDTKRVFAVLGDIGLHEPIGRYGTLQASLREVLGPLDDVTFGPDHLAALWAPRTGIVIDPATSWGAPRIAGRRITTHEIHALRSVMSVRSSASGTRRGMGVASFG